MDGELPDPTDEQWRSLRDDVMRQGADLHTAEDVVQETWLRAVLRKPQDTGRFEGWLRVVATRYLRRLRRSQRRRSELVQEAARDPSVLPAEPEPTSLARFVAELPELYREVMRLRYLEERGVPEIAVLTGRSEAAVRTQLARGLSLLRARLEADGPRRDHAWSFLAWLTELRRRRPRTALLGACCAIVLIIGAVARLFLEVEPRSTELVVADAPVPAQNSPDGVAGALELEPDRRLAVATESWGRVVQGIAGVVRAPDGTPVPGAKVHAQPADESRRAIETQADAAGRYTLEADRQDLVWATHASFMPSNRCYLASWPRGEPLDLDLRSISASVEYVVRYADGEPAVGARVAALSPTEDREPSSRGMLEFPAEEDGAFTDSEGRVRVNFPPEAWVELNVAIDGLPFLIRPVYSTEAARMREIVLPRPAGVIGAVVDAGGAPAAARVELSQLSGARENKLHTGPDGRFEFDGLPPGPFVVRVFAQRDEEYSAWHIGELAPDRVDDLGLIFLSRDTTIHGRVFRRELPAAGVEVSLHSEEIALSDVLRTTTTDGEGHYAFGACSKSAFHRVFTTSAIVGVRGDWAVARPGPDSIDLEAAVEEPASPLVVQFDGEPVPRAVELRYEPCSSIVLEQDAGGRFRAPPLPADNYEVFAWTPQLDTWRCGMITHDPLGTSTHHFVVPLGAWLSVEADLPDGVDEGKMRVGLLSPTFNRYGLGWRGGLPNYRELLWDEERREFRLFVPPQEYLLATAGTGLADTSSRIVVEDAVDNRAFVTTALGSQTLLVFRSPRATAYGEVTGITFDSSRGPIYFDLHWTDQLRHELGFAYEMAIPRDADQVHVLTRPRQSETIAPLRGSRAIAAEELNGSPRILEIVLE